MVIKTFKPHLEILPPVQQHLWPSLRPARELGFTLYGGTAVALQLGNRLSIDFDFFSDKPLNHDSIRKTFPFVDKATILQDEPDALTVLVRYENFVDKQVKLSFFGTIDFGRVCEPSLTEDGTLYIASVEDLMATKLKVLLQRVALKDYRDIAALIKSGVSLSYGLGAARALYGLSFQPSESLKALVYFEGKDLNLLTPEEQNILVKAVSEVYDIPNVPIISQSLTP